MNIFLILLIFSFHSFTFAGEEQDLLKSCGRQELAACETLGAKYLGRSEWEKAYLVGEALCSREMGLGCLFAGSARLAQKQLQEAQTYLNRGCDLFEPLSCRSLGRLMSKAKETAKANMYFKRACHFGLKEICRDLKKSSSWLSPTAMDLVAKMKVDCQDTKSTECLTHLGTINSCALPLIKLDCELLAGYLSIYFSSRLIQAEAKASLLKLYEVQKVLKQSSRNSYSYDLAELLKEAVVNKKYQYVVGFKKSCGRGKTNTEELYPGSLKHLGPRVLANIAAYFSQGHKDDCYDIQSGYEAYAVGGLDPLNPAQLDVWKIDQDQRVEHVLDGLPKP